MSDRAPAPTLAATGQDPGLPSGADQPGAGRPGAVQPSQERRARLSSGLRRRWPLLVLAGGALLLWRFDPVQERELRFLFHGLPAGGTHAVVEVRTVAGELLAQRSAPLLGDPAELTLEVAIPPGRYEALGAARPEGAGGERPRTSRRFALEIDDRREYLFEIGREALSR